MRIEWVLAMGESSGNLRGLLIGVDFFLILVDV